jgi:putative transposase
MARPRQKLDERKQAEAVRRRLKTEPPGWRRERLLAVQLGLEGEQSLEQIAAAVSHARSTIQEWFARFREGGLELLLRDERAGNRGAEGLLDEDASKQLEAGLERGTWRTGPEIQRWLHKAHGIAAALPTIYKWLGKAGARLRVPRPSHVKKEPAAAESFKERLVEKLRALELPKERPVRLWVLDEMRYGLHSFSRRVWVKKGVRPVAPSQQCYQWGYLYGAVGVGLARSEFFYAETVDQEHLAVYYEQIGRSDPAACHVLIQDGAGFHLPDGHAQLPANVRIVTLPPYSPELNPVEKLWDQIKDVLCNRAFATIEGLQEVITLWLAAFWADARRPFGLIGRGWLLDRANTSSASIIPML